MGESGLRGQAVAVLTSGCASACCLESRDDGDSGREPCAGDGAEGVLAAMETPVLPSSYLPTAAARPMVDGAWAGVARTWIAGAQAQCDKLAARHSDSGCGAWGGVSGGPLEGV